MTDATATKLVDEVVKRSIQARLNAEGYKKTARTFSRENEGGVYQVVNIQLSQGNTAQQAKFTINLGVFFPVLRQISLQSPLNRPPREYDCSLRERIGMLTPDRLDRWWTVATGTDLDATAREVVEAWASLGQPWIQRCSHLESARKEALRAGNNLAAMIIAIALGDGTAAKELFDVIIARCSPHARAHFEAIGKAHNLIG